MFITGQEELDAIAAVFKSGQFMRYRGGEDGFTTQFEAQIQQDMHIAHALCMNSGTNALIAAMIGLKLGHGDEVIVPAYTWVASAMAPLMAGAIPVMADIDDTMCLDPADFERKITPHTKAVIPVHMINRLCDLKRIKAIAAKHNIKVIEDACQAFGIQYADGAYAGTIGDAGTFSFNVFKNIMCGEGGMLLTADRTVYERALMFHDAGCYTREHASQVAEPFFPGFNFRVSELHGAILCAQYRRLAEIKAKLAAHKAIATEVLSSAKAFRLAPENDPGTLSCIVHFDSAAAAADFAVKNGQGRLSDSGRHLVSNWTPILEKNYYNAELNPYRYAKREINYDIAQYSFTLELLERSVLIDYGFKLDDAQYREFCAKLAAF